LNFRRGKRFGKNICNLLCSRNIRGCNALCVDCISKPIIAKIQVFYATMMLWVLGNTDGRLVVNVEGRRLSHRIAKFTKDIVHPGDFFACFNSRDKFSLCGRKCNNGLQLASPTNSTTSHHSHITTSGASRIHAITMCSISISGEYCRA
jgi:hypothetical protein